ncbi:gephyrin-like molybdotransferase Glp [Saccharospirillum mangrovi]|uniref:molybdopterin molybdotransferase MoeA n=1 Tax=Saccharospirillum mangrovi TaxID=2161747 RepID=UPI000D34E883|nr:gephyrin-like molybdotransferase Glp [Saccharospirillum mangrovi]
MGCSDKPGLQPLDAGLDQLLTRITPLEGSETVALTNSLGRITAKAVRAETPVPAWDNSAMDGYALRRADLLADKPLPIQGRSLAGQPYTEPLKPGYCVRVMTGAVLPAGCDAVVMQEEAEVSDDGVVFHKVPEEGNNIRHAGDDCRVGDRLLPEGHRIRPQDLALLASVGCAEVSVRPRLKVALLATGDELRQPGEALNVGDLYDSNRPALYALLERLGVQVHDFGVVADDPDALREVLQQADASCDLIITSGGVSVGEADYTRQVLGELGEIELWKLAIKPGKPLAFGRLNRSWFIGLPGNPVSSLVTFHLVAARAIRRLQGQPDQPLAQLTAVTTDALHKTPGRMDFQRGVWRQTEHGVEVRSSRTQQASHILGSMTEANCYIALEQDRGPVEPGETVTLWLFDGLFAD